MDMACCGADFYAFSPYKVYGPHMGALCGSAAAWERVGSGPNHFFVPAKAVPYKWELGGVSHEACAGFLALQPYLTFLAASAPAAVPAAAPAAAHAVTLAQQPQRRAGSSAAPMTGGSGYGSYSAAELGDLLSCDRATVERAFRAMEARPLRGMRPAPRRLCSRLRAA